MTTVERVARTCHATTAGKRSASNSEYVILLRDPSGAGKWGLYVGQTSRDPDLRFDQHKAGRKASRAIRRFGVRLLPSFSDHLNPMKRWKLSSLRQRWPMAFATQAFSGLRAANDAPRPPVGCDKQRLGQSARCLAKRPDQAGDLPSKRQRAFDASGALQKIVTMACYAAASRKARPPS